MTFTSVSGVSRYSAIPSARAGWAVPLINFIAPGECDNYDPHGNQLRRAACGGKTRQRRERRDSPERPPAAERRAGPERRGSPERRAAERRAGPERRGSPERPPAAERRAGPKTGFSRKTGSASKTACGGKMPCGQKTTGRRAGVVPHAQPTRMPSFAPKAHLSRSARVFRAPPVFRRRRLLPAGHLSRPQGGSRASFGLRPSFAAGVFCPPGILSRPQGGSSLEFGL